MTTVVIVDDQPMVRDGLRLILELAGVEVVGEASDGDEGAELVLALTPDVVLMDVMMSPVGGIEATRRIVEARCPSRVLILTTFDLDSHVYEGLQVGAAGFLLKDVTSEGLVRAVEQTAAGETPMSAAVLRRLVDHFVSRPPEPVSAPALVTLSEREREVLGLIGAGHSNTEIAEALVISMATVKTHVRHILAKLDLRDRVQAVVLAHRLGLVDPRR